MTPRAVASAVPSGAGALWALAAAAAVSAVVALLLTCPGWPPLRRRGDPGSTSGAAGEPGGLRRPRRAAALLGGVLGGGAVLGAGLQGAHLVVVVTAAVSLAVGVRLAANGARARVALARRRTVIDYCEALVGELRAGQPVARAVERAVDAWAESEPVAAAAHLGADVALALRRLSDLPGAAGVRRLAGAWELCATTGSGLAFAAEQVLATARAEEATDRLVQAELASARATARLVTVLPLVVLVAAQGIGARPWAFLLSTVAGAACLAAGAALTLSGLSWIDRIAASAAEGR